MKLQVGDRVRVKENAYEIETGYIFFANDMKKFCGKEFVINAVGDNFYKLEGAYCPSCPSLNNDGYWIWAEDWVEYVDSVKVTITNDELLNIFN